jgi:hypothetical protein
MIEIVVSDMTRGHCASAIAQAGYTPALALGGARP